MSVTNLNGLIEYHSVSLASLLQGNNVVSNGKIKVYLNLERTEIGKEWCLSISLSTTNDYIPKKFEVILYAKDNNAKINSWVLDVAKVGTREEHYCDQRSWYPLLMCDTDLLIAINVADPAAIIYDLESELMREFILKTPRDVFLVLRNADYSYKCSFTDRLFSTNDAGQRGIWVHKAALCARSDVFKKMFTIDMVEQRTGTVSISQQYCDTCGPDVLAIFCALLYIPTVRFELSALSYELDEMLTIAQLCDDSRDNLKRRRISEKSETKDINTDDEKSDDEKSDDEKSDDEKIDDKTGDDEESNNTGSRFFSLKQKHKDSCKNGHCYGKAVNDCTACDERLEANRISWEFSDLWQSHLERIWFPVYDLLHQYNYKYAIRKLTLQFLKTVHRNSLLLYYDLANRYEIQPLQKACAIFGWDIQKDIQNRVDKPVALLQCDKWTTRQHIAFATFLQERLDSPN